MKTKITLSVLVLLFACLTLNAFNSSTNEIPENLMVESASEIVDLNGFLFEFLGVQYDLDGTSTWTYKVTGNGARRNLSHWKLKLFNEQNVTSSLPDTWEVHVDPHFQYYGIKWDSSVNKNGGIKTFSFTLNGRYDVGNVDFGYKAGRKLFHGIIQGPTIPSTNSVSGSVFNDANVNGIIDGVEGFLDGVQVNLYDDENANGLIDSGEVLLESTTTDGVGGYAFVNISALNIVVEAILPSNTTDFSYQETTVLRASIFLTVNDISNVDFGIKKTQIVFYDISGIVYDDDNQNGMNDNETGLITVEVKMYDDANANGTLDAGESLITTTTTDVNGTYTFTLVMFNHVIVEAVKPRNTATFNYIATTDMQEAITMSNQNVIDANFGIDKVPLINYTISGNVFNDANGDGDSISDEGLTGVTVRLLEDTNQNGIIDRGEPLIAITTSDRNGNYQFTELTDIFVVVQVLIPGNTSQFHYTATTPINVSLNTGLTTVDVDFGITRTIIILYSVRGVVFDDDNENGIANPEEGSLDGLSVEIYADTDSSGTFDANIDTLVAFTQTNNGELGYTDPNYILDAVPPGQAFVVIVIPNDNPPFESWTATYDPETGTVNPDGIFPTVITGDLVGVNFGINYVNLGSSTRDTNTDDILITDETAIEDVSERLRLYPNPTVKQITINAEELAGDVTVEIYNDKGYKVKSVIVKKFGDEIEVDVSELRSGMYYAKFVSRNKVANKKFAKK